MDLGRLEKARYIQCRPNPQDRRTSIIRPVPTEPPELHALYPSNSQALMRAPSADSESKLNLILAFSGRANSGSVGSDEPG